MIRCARAHQPRPHCSPSPSPSFSRAPPRGSTLVAAVSSGRAPSLLAYTGSATLGKAPQALTLPAPANATVTAVAVSRDGRRVVSFGSTPNFSLVVHELPSGEVRAASEPTRAPGLVTRAAVAG